MYLTILGHFALKVNVVYIQHFSKMFCSKSLVFYNRAGFWQEFIFLMMLEKILKKSLMNPRAIAKNLGISKSPNYVCKTPHSNQGLVSIKNF